MPEEQKGCKWGSRGTKDILLIDKTVLKGCNKRHTNLSMAWIDYKKAYDFVPHSWINECMEMFGIAENVRNLLKTSMEQCIKSPDLKGSKSRPGSRILAQ